MGQRKRSGISQPALPGMPRAREFMTPEKRYPRGYTPERQKEIRDAFNGIDVIENYDAKPNPNLPNVATGWDIRSPFTGVYSADNIVRDNPETKAKVVDAVARTKVPADIVKKLRTFWVHKNSSGEPTNGIPHPETGELGYVAGITNTQGYLDANDNRRKWAYETHVGEKQLNRNETALAHELGHVHHQGEAQDARELDFEANPPQPLPENDYLSSSDVDRTTRENAKSYLRGESEGVADKFSEEHRGKVFKKTKGKRLIDRRKRELSLYESTNTALNILENNMRRDSSITPFIPGGEHDEEFNSQENTNQYRHFILDDAIKSLHTAAGYWKGRGVTPEQFEEIKKKLAVNQAKDPRYNYIRSDVSKDRLKELKNKPRQLEFDYEPDSYIPSWVNGK